MSQATAGPPRDLAFPLSGTATNTGLMRWSAVGIAPAKFRKPRGPPWIASAKCEGAVATGAPPMPGAGSSARQESCDQDQQWA